MPTCSFPLREYYLYKSVRLYIVEGRILSCVSIIVLEVRTEKRKITNKSEIQVKRVKLVCFRKWAD